MVARWLESFHMGRGGISPLLILSFSCLCLYPLAAAPQGGRVQGDVSPIAFQDMRDTISNLRYQVNNHEQEIREFDEKLKNVDSIIESVRDQLSDASKAHKEQLKGSTQTIDGKITALEALNKNLVADLKQFKTYTTDSAAALAQYKQKMIDLEKIIDQQNQNIEHLQAAMRSLMEALQGKDSAIKAPTDATEAACGNTYRIKAGDSLDKIARAHGTTVQAIKDLNGLTTDKIVVGKALLIPEKKSE